jgi:hypothetical protein
MRSQVKLFFLIKKNSLCCRILLGALLYNDSLHWFKGLSKLSVGLSSSMYHGVKHLSMSLVFGSKGLHGVWRWVIWKTDNYAGKCRAS